MVDVGDALTTFPPDPSTNHGGIGIVAGAVTSKWAKGTGGPAGDECQNLVAFPANLSATQHASSEDLSCSLGAKNPTAIAYGFQQRIARNGRGDMGDTVDSLNAQSGTHGDSAPCVALAYDTRSGLAPNGSIEGSEISQTLRAREHEPPAVITNTAVRRLTPTECARLQGFPDDYLDIQFKGKPAADSHKYRALGNSMAVPVMAWIGRQIQVAVDYRPTFDEVWVDPDEVSRLWRPLSAKQPEVMA
jgi:DNA (cytosine-5)-methyltransferase 1